MALCVAGVLVGVYGSLCGRYWLGFMALCEAGVYGSLCGRYWSGFMALCVAGVLVGLLTHNDEPRSAKLS